MQTGPGPSLTIGMVAGEASGDNLGAALVREILKLKPDTRFVGVAGPAMLAEGFAPRRSASSSDSAPLSSSSSPSPSSSSPSSAFSSSSSDAPQFDMETLSVNGFVDPLLRLPKLIKLLFDVRDSVLASGANCFVGVDSNFFNLLLAGMLKKRGVKTVHYVSPTVWAWRRGRVKKIKKQVDLMMTLYPFETAIYEDNDVPVKFVGHPKADEIEAHEGQRNQLSAREALGIKAGARVLAILPGSRSTEVNLSGQDFLQTAQHLATRVDTFVIPAANPARLAQLQQMLLEYPLLAGKVLLVLGQSRQAMTAADVVLVNSGTATLEAMLLRKPMVMSYRVARFTYAIVSRLVTTDFFALPNILAGRELVREFIQDDAQPQALADAVGSCFDDDQRVLLAQYDEIHNMLRQDEAPGRAAAIAVLEACGLTFPAEPPVGDAQ